jgi:TPR repeat protein
MRTQRGGVALALLATLVSTAAHADFRSALKAYASGQYDVAHAQFLALAELGDGASQYNLGAMALHGQGGPNDIATGIGWLLAAASNGFHSLKPEQLAAAQSQLTDEQRRVAQAIVDRYGHAALLETVLPSRDRASGCPDLVYAHLSQAAPAEYPVYLRRQGQDGIVILELTVGVDGLARDPEILMSVPDSEIPAAAIESFLNSRYTPAARGGVPIESRMKLKMTFSITGGGVLWDVGVLAKVRKAAAAGDPGSEYLTGLAATLDPTVGISAPQAHQLLLSAAQGGEPDAQYYIGRSFEAPAPCGASAKEQVWLQAAATSGDPSAQVALAEILAHGTPSSDEVSRARSLLEQAARSDRFYVRKHVVALMAASSIEGIRDPPTALIVAKELARGPIQSDPQLFEAVAAAYAANGKFSPAVSSQETAIDRAKALEWNTRRMEERLAAYRSSQPWFGDLFSVPPAVAPPAPLKHTVKFCRGSDPGCGRLFPDQPTRPTGSRIP